MVVLSVIVWSHHLQPKASMISSYSKYQNTSSKKWLLATFLILHRLSHQFHAIHWWGPIQHWINSLPWQANSYHKKAFGTPTSCPNNHPNQGRLKSLAFHKNDNLTFHAMGWHPSIRKPHTFHHHQHHNHKSKTFEVRQEGVSSEAHHSPFQMQKNYLFLVLIHHMLVKSDVWILGCCVLPPVADKWLHQHMMKIAKSSLLFNP